LQLLNTSTLPNASDTLLDARKVMQGAGGALDPVASLLREGGNKEWVGVDGVVAAAQSAILQLADQAPCLSRNLKVWILKYSARLYLVYQQQ
jgi:hypothetical protein